MERYRVLSGEPWWNGRIKSQEYVAVRCDAPVWRYMRENGLSLVICARQSGEVMFLSAGPDEGECFSSMLPLPGAMGACLNDGIMIVGGSDGVIVLRDISNADPNTSVFILAKRHSTGNVGIRDVSWSGGEGRIRFVNTMFSSICELDDVSGFRTVWRPPTVEQVDPSDSVHINGMATVPGGRVVVTMLGLGGRAANWRESGPDGGVLYDASGGHAILSNLSLPHSPVWSGGKIWFLESGRGILCHLKENGHKQVQGEFDGVARGLSIAETMAAIGLSPVRKADDSIRHLMKGRFPSRTSCEVALVDIASGARLGGIYLPMLPEISSLHWHRRAATFFATPAAEHGAAYFTYREDQSSTASDRLHRS